MSTVSNSHILKHPSHTADDQVPVELVEGDRVIGNHLVVALDDDLVGLDLEALDDVALIRQVEAVYAVAHDLLVVRVEAHVRAVHDRRVHAVPLDLEPVRVAPH